MTTKRAPTVATWLLKRFGCGPNTDAVLGDLAEHYLHKSRMWYWRQVLKGIPVSIVKEALGHKTIAAKAIVAGCITWLMFLTIYPNFVFGFAGGPFLTFNIFGAPPLIGAWAALSSPVATSLILPNDSTVFRIWIQFALPLIAWTVCGWVVTRVDIGRTHRDLAPLFAGFVLLLNLVAGLPGLIWFLNKMSRSTYVMNGVPFSTIAPDLIALTVAHAAVAVFGILLGGSLRRNKAEVAT